MPNPDVQHLREVLSKLQEHGIVLNGKKCMLGVTEVQVLGHMVSAVTQHVASFLCRRSWLPYMPSRSQQQWGK